MGPWLANAQPAPTATTQISTLGSGSSLGSASPIQAQSSRRERNGVESKGRPPKIRAAPNFTVSKLAPSCSPTTPVAIVCTGSATGIATECSESCTAYLTDYYGNATKCRHCASACLRRREYGTAESHPAATKTGTRGWSITASAASLYPSLSVRRIPSQLHPQFPTPHCRSCLRYPPRP